MPILTSLRRAFCAAYAVCVVAGLVGLAAAAAFVQAGRWSDRLDVASHFAPFLLAVTLAGLLLALALPAGGLRRAGIGLGLLAALSPASMVLPEVVAAHLRRQSPGQGPVLKVIQYNMLASNPDPLRSVDWLVAQDADIVVVEEATDNSWKANRRLRKAFPHWSSCNLPRSCSVLVLSRLPMADRGGGLLPPMAWARYRWRGREVTVVGTHYYWPYPAGLQQVQARRLGAFVAGQQDKANLIVAGDFNSTPWSFAMKRQDRAFAIERRTRALWSWPARPHFDGRLPAWLPFLPIDHVYAGEGWETVSVRRGPNLGSDHYPVIVELRAR